MTRRAAPSEEELRSNIVKRMFIPAGGIPSTNKASLSNSKDKRMFVPEGGFPSLNKPSSGLSNKRMHIPAYLPTFKKPIRQHAKDMLFGLLGLDDAANEVGKRRHGRGGTSTTTACASNIVWRRQPH
jgi:hypothetical protein